MVLTGHFLFFLKFRKCPTDTLWFAHLFILPDSLWAFPISNCRSSAQESKSNQADLTHRVCSECIRCQGLKYMSAYWVRARQCVRRASECVCLSWPSLGPSLGRDGKVSIQQVCPGSFTLINCQGPPPSLSCSWPPRVHVRARMKAMPRSPPAWPHAGS